MKNLKKFVFFFLVILSFIGAVGGAFIAANEGEYVVAIGVDALAFTAWPKFKEYLVYLTI